MSNSNIHITYKVHSSDDIESRAEALMLEQAVELPRKAITDPWTQENILGEILSIEDTHDGDHHVTIAHPWRTSANDAAQLLNVIFGNSSLQPDVLVEHISLPEEGLEMLGGPQLGISGIREKLSVQSRALTCTALKPMGLTPDKMAELCRTFALGGIDIIKDDHGLADHEFCPFKERVEKCFEAAQKASEETGKKVIYSPNLLGTPSAVLEQFEFCRSLGVDMVMLEPMLTGMPLMHEIVQKADGIAILAHPAFAGALRMSQVAQLGQLFRWYGADGVIYPHFGGRFAYSEEACRDLSEELRKPYPGLPPAFPVPAGGIKTSRVKEILNFYGPNTMLLIGGSLLEAGDQLLDRTREFVDQVAKVSAE